MKILFFSDHFRPEPSAPAAHVYERAKLWVRWGHDVTVLCSAPNFPEGRVYDGYKNRWRFIEDMDGMRVVRVKTFIVPNEGFILRTLDYISYMFSAFAFSLFERKPDVVISTSPHIFVPVAGILFSLIRRVPHVMEVRDLWPASIVSVTGDGRKGFVYRLLERLELWLYKKSKRIISLTKSFVGEMTSRNIPENKIDVVINGANLELFSPQPKDSSILNAYSLNNRFIVGYLGTIGLAHDLGNAISAAVLLRGRNITFFFVGVGAAKAQLQSRVEAEGLDNVVFADRQLKEDMPNYLSVCDISLIHLKDVEVFKTVVPSKIFEAAAMGLPVIYVGPKGEGSSIVESHGIGVYVKASSPKDLAAAILELSENPLEMDKMARNTRSTAPLYSRDRQAKDSLESLRKASELN